ncbi:MAG: hypothetical protein DWQ04_12275 [Chloroflexi bacterium]|nr:MAG: hypothetical protein DWQ04_12275 [Chloroflexota bacterium]
MKNILLSLAIFLVLTLAACGGDTPDIGEIVDTAQDGLETAQETVQEVVDEVSETMEEGDPLTIDDVLGSYTFHTPSNDWHYGEITRDGELLKWTNRAGVEWSLTPDFPNNRLLTDDSFPYQNDYQNFDLVIEGGAYTGFTSNNDFWAHDAPELTQEPNNTEGPAGETFDVDPTQPIDVEDSSGTQVSINANELVDENGNPATGDVKVNMFTPDMANEGGEAEGAEAEVSTSCEPLTVWSYNPETGLWEEEGLAPYQDDRCVESIGTVSVEVTDDEGNEYDLAEGAEAEVSIPCEPTPDEVLTVWSYNAETGLWEEEGTTVVEEGERCSAEVSDLSNVNFGTTAEEPAEEPADAPTTTETQTETGEVELVLASNALVAGDVVAIEGNSSGPYTVATGDYFAYFNTEWYLNYPKYGIQSGDIVSSIVIANADITLQASIIAGAVAEAGNAEAAAQLLDTPSGLTVDSTYRVASIGAVNQPLLADDFVELLLGDTNSSEPPYLVNIYRGENRELVATFTINKQQ